MKPSCNKTTGPTYRVKIKKYDFLFSEFNLCNYYYYYIFQSPVEGGHEGQLDRDLRSRGLCLVPLGCLSYVAGDGGGIWTPPGFNGGTSR